MRTFQRRNFCWVCWLTALATAVALTLAEPSHAKVRVIGDWEGSMASGYTGVNWTLGSGIITPPQFISVTDPNYQGGVTRGNSALLFTTPQQWITANYLILSGALNLLNDTADFPYLLVDVTTFGGPDTPEEGPNYRQMFGIFNNPVTGFYDSNPDNDIQLDFPVAGFADVARTETVVIDMTGPDPAESGDDKNFLNLKSQQARADHTDGTPLDPFYWQIFWVFQGTDTPDTPQVQVVIDNARFSTIRPEEAPPGDYDIDNDVDGDDFLLWQRAYGRTGPPVNGLVQADGDGSLVVDDADFAVWARQFGDVTGPAAAVPEPASVLLALGGLVAVFAGIRRRR